MRWLETVMYGLAGLAVITLAVAVECRFMYLFAYSVVVSAYHWS